jgi:hypothetical protein
MRPITIAVASALSLIPALNIVYIVVTTGANNISNDYIAYVGTIDQILSGTYDWRRYFRDTFVVGSHSVALPFLIRLGVIKLFQWNIYAELYIGLAVAFAKLVLLYLAYTRFVKNVFSGILWVLLAALIFSTSQINVWTYGDATLQIGLSQLGLALCVWGLTQYRGRWAGIAWMTIGGFVASFSGGGGPLVWPVALLGLVLLGYRKVAQYVTWLCAAAVAALPYVLYMVLAPKAANRQTLSLFSYEFIVRAIGWPFSQQFSVEAATRHGVIGLGLAAVGLILIWAKCHTAELIQVVPALLVLAFSTANIWVISVFRGTVGLAPWYAAHFILFWIGLLGLAHVFWANRRNPTVRRPLGYGATSIAGSAWALVLVSALLFLYSKSNITYTDKVMYLYSRSPASESCLRNYRTAPTYCEEYLFQWGVGNPGIVARLAEPLERHQISAFAPRQQWSLQGDYVLDTVRLDETPGVPDIQWIENHTPQSVPWSDYHHLNLYLHAPNAILWTMAIPANVEQADFRSAIAMNEYAPILDAADGVTFEISVLREGMADEVLFSEHLTQYQREWHPISIQLEAYAGQTITLRLAAKPGSNVSADWAVYRYPHIDLLVAQENNIAPQPNRDRFIPARSNEDMQFSISDETIWRTANMQRAGEPPNGSTTWVVQQDPMLYNAQPLNLCLADYSHIVVRMAASADIDPRAIELYMQFAGEQLTKREQTVRIPLLSGGGLHDYSYDLKLLELPASARLTELRLDPVYAAAPTGANRVQIADFRLIRSDNSGGCAESAPVPTANDFRFDLARNEDWIEMNMQRLPSNDPTLQTWEVAIDPILQFNGRLNICMADFTHAYVRMAASPDIQARGLQIFFQFDDQAGFLDDDRHSAHIPLFSDGLMHTYSVDLSGFARQPGTRLTAIRLDPVYRSTAEGPNRIQLGDFRLIHGGKTSACAN